MFQGSGCWETFDSNDIVALLEDPTTWYLTDSLTPSPALTNAITILVSPPLRKYLSDRSKDPSIPPVHYLPTWSLEELRRVAHVYLKSPEGVEKRFYLMGGIARCVLEEDRDLEAPINEAIKMQLLGKLWLASLEVEPPYYTKCKIVAFSEYAKERLLEELRDRPDEELESYVSYFKEDLPFARSFVERWFANCANRQLSAGGKFQVCSLEDGLEYEIDIPPTKPQVFTKLSECTDPSVYYVSRAKNSACIDSAISGVGCFRMTISLEPKITRKQMDEIDNTKNMNNLLYYVVPHTKYEEFKKQELTKEMETDNNVIGGETNTEKENYKENENSNENNKVRKVNNGDNYNQTLQKDSIE